MFVSDMKLFLVFVFFSLQVSVCLDSKMSCYDSADLKTNFEKTNAGHSWSSQFVEFYQHNGEFSSYLGNMALPPA